MGVFFAVILFTVCLFVGNTPLSAQTQESETGLQDESAIILGEAPAALTPSGASSVVVVIRMVLVLALAALAIYGVVFFIKRLARPQENKDPHLKILARSALSNDSFAAVVSVGHKAWLVAGSSGGVNLISEIDDDEALETMFLEDARRTAEAGTKRFMDFRSLLSRLGSSGRPGKDSHANNGSIADNSSLAERLRNQRERLKGP